MNFSNCFKNSVNLCTIGNNRPKISYLNIIENKFPTSTYGQLQARPNSIVEINNCIFKNNQDILFYTDSTSKFIISKSYIIHSGTLKVGTLIF